MELITSKELLPRLISAHEQDASFISLHLQDKSFLCWHTKATHTQARTVPTKTSLCYWHAINNAKDIWCDEFDVTPYLTFWIVFRIMPRTVTSCMVKRYWNAHCSNHAYANVCVCAWKKNGLFSTAHFHLERLTLSPLLEWKYGSIGWKMFPPLLYKKEQHGIVWRIFYLLSHNRTELCP